MKRVRLLYFFSCDCLLCIIIIRIIIITSFSIHFDKKSCIFWLGWLLLVVFCTCGGWAQIYLFCWATKEQHVKFVSLLWRFVWQWLCTVHPAKVVVVVDWEWRSQSQFSSSVKIKTIGALSLTHFSTLLLYNWIKRTSIIWAIQNLFFSFKSILIVQYEFYKWQWYKLQKSM